MTGRIPPDAAAADSDVTVRVPDPSPTSLDRIVHDRIRLGILAALALNPTLTFTDLRRMLGATDGNLTVHARRLEDSGYISVTKTTDRRAVRTSFTLAPAGRAALRKYLADMKRLVTALSQTALSHTALSPQPPAP